MPLKDDWVNTGSLDNHSSYSLEDDYWMSVWDGTIPPLHGLQLQAILAGDDEEAYVEFLLDIKYNDSTWVSVFIHINQTGITMWSDQNDTNVVDMGDKPSSMALVRTTTSSPIQLKYAAVELQVDGTAVDLPGIVGQGVIQLRWIGVYCTNSSKMEITPLCIPTRAPTGAPTAPTGAPKR
jgi:hypothetical protein